ncbi:MAG: uridine kinase, partial [Acidimicrobiia bacterium]|nr:uridine kinase [Acidimicrobiia bacterium]
ESLLPLSAGRAARYRRYDWERRALGGWTETPPGRVVIIEGVGSSRMAFRPYLTFAIWVETPRATRLERGVKRDGDDTLPLWKQWMVAEDKYIEEERPDRSADLVVAGAPTVAHDPRTEVVVLRVDPA